MQGEIVVRENPNEYYFGKVTDDFPVRVCIDVTHTSIYQDVAFGGSPGSGEAYMKGSWQCSDLLELVRIFLRNRDVPLRYHGLRPDKAEGTDTQNVTRVQP